MTQDDLRAHFMQGVAVVAAVSLGIGYPTKASAPHLIVNAFKRILAVAAETDVTFKEAEKVRSNDHIHVNNPFYSSKNILLIHQSLLLLLQPLLQHLQLHLKLKLLQQRKKKKRRNLTKIWVLDYLTSFNPSDLFGISNNCVEIKKCLVNDYSFLLI